MAKLKINVQLLAMKAHYFFWFGGMVSVLPFLVVHAKQLGFSGFVIGTVFAISSLSKIFLIPLLGGVADKFKNQKTIFIIGQVLAACGFLSLVFLPALPKSHMVDFTCSSDGYAVNIQGVRPCAEELLGKIANETTCKVNCPLMPDAQNDSLNQHPNIFDARFGANLLSDNSKQFQLPIASVIVNGTRMEPYCANTTGAATECDISCDAAILVEIVSKPKVPDKHVYSDYHFWLLVLAIFIVTSGTESTLCFAEAVCLQILGERRCEYGYQKMFASLGWGVFGIITGLLIDFYNKGNETKNHAPTFVMAFGVALLSATVSYKLQYTQQPHKANITRDMARELLTLRAIAFLLWCAAFGVYCGVTWGFIFWLLEDLAVAQGCVTVGKIKTIEGISLALGSLASEIPFYFVSPWIFKRLSYINAMTLSLLLMGIQFISYSVMSNPWWNLPIAVLKGTVLSMCCATMASHASIIAPRGTETTTQGTVNASYQVGSALGNFLGGVLLSTVGPSIMFRIFGIAAIVLCILHALVQCLIRDHTAETEIELNQVNLLKSLRSYSYN